ncbi:MAG: DUF1592 domain-containing protein [Myxococcota bacterium]
MRVVLCVLALVVGCEGTIDGGRSVPDIPPGRGPSQGPPDGADAIAYWNAYCLGCHGEFQPGSALSTGNDAGDFRLDAVAAIELHGDGLETYIADEMPVAEPELCVGECAETLGAYLRGIEPPSTEVVCAEDSAAAVGARRVTLLSSTEYQNTLEVLLGVETDFGARVENNDGRRGGFVDMSGNSMSGTLLDTYVSNADEIAAWAVSQNRPFECSEPVSCAERFVDEFLFDAFRGPVSAEQGALYRALFADHGESGMRLARRAALTSPHFLYRVEVGTDVNAAREAGYTDLLEGAPSDALVLAPYELASTLAFRLTATAPDRALLGAARDGRLRSRAEVRAQVERLIDSERGRARMADFVTTWFGIAEVEDLLRPNTPEFTDEVKRAMVQEVQTHFLHVFYDEAVPWSEFFGGDYTFVNRTLAEFYGIEGEFDESFQRVQVTGRGGPIASGAFMAANAHVDRTAPILRAVHTRQTALCQYIDPPNSPIAGDDIDEQRARAQARVTEAEAEAGALSSRDFYYLYTDGIDACAGCHARIINPNFGMEDFDNVGRLRPAAGDGLVTETLNGVELEVSTQGTLFGVASTADSNVLEYAGAKDLSNQIANTEAVISCLARRGFRFLSSATYVDRDLDSGFREVLTPEQRRDYTCVARRMLDTFEANNQSPRAMFIELATDTILYYRR